MRDTAEVAARRLGDHLREVGCDVLMVDTADRPARAAAKETWRWVRDGSGYIAAYRVSVDDRLSATLADIRAHPSPETWIALEITGSAATPRIAVACAFRSDGRPGAAAPLAGLIPLRGRQGPGLDALNPLSVARLQATPVPLANGLLEGLDWQVAPLATRT